jgi:hypothetical protein
MSSPLVSPALWVEVHLPVELAGGCLARAVALVQAERAARDLARQQGQPVGILVRWLAAAGPAPVPTADSPGTRSPGLYVLNRHLLLSELRLEPDTPANRLALAARLEQLLSAGPERAPAIKRFLPQGEETLQAGLERLWRGYFPAVVFADPGQRELPEAAVLARFGMAPQAQPLPRVWLLSSATLRALERLGLNVEAALGEPLLELQKSPNSPLPAVIPELRNLGKQWRQTLLDLRAPLAELDRGLSVQARRAAAAAEELLEALARRGERLHKNQSGTRHRHQRRAANALWPLGQPQIEILSCLQFAAIYGSRWLETLRQGLPEIGAEPRGLVLDAEHNGEIPRQVASGLDC